MSYRSYKLGIANMTKLYAIVIVALSLSLLFYMRAYDSAVHKLDKIALDSKYLEQEIKEANERTKQQEELFNAQLALKDKERLAELESTRQLLLDSFESERVRLQSDNKSYREERDTLSRTFRACERDSAETYRLFLHTLDEAERINAAYTSCRSLLKFD